MNERKEIRDKEYIVSFWAAGCPLGLLLLLVIIETIYYTFSKYKPLTYVYVPNNHQPSWSIWNKRLI